MVLVAEILCALPRARMKISAIPPMTAPKQRPHTEVYFLKLQLPRYSQTLWEDVAQQIQRTRRWRLTRVKMMSYPQRLRSAMEGMRDLRFLVLLFTTFHILHVMGFGVKVSSAWILLTVLHLSSTGWKN